MTTARQKRCTHCGQGYVFQSSGEGCGHPLNDPNWCPQCKGAVNEAVAKLPRLLEPRWVPVDEVPTLVERPTADDCRRWFDIHVERNGGMWIRRIWPGLISADGAIMNIWGVTAADGPYRDFPFLFQVSEWSDNREPAVVKVQVEVVKATGIPTGSLW